MTEERDVEGRVNGGKTPEARQGKNRLKQSDLTTIPLMYRDCGFETDIAAAE